MREKKSNNQLNLSEELLEGVRRDLEWAELSLRKGSELELKADEKNYARRLRNLHYFHLQRGKAKYILEHDAEIFFSCLKSACAAYLEEKISNTREGNAAELDKDAGMYFLLSFFYGDKEVTRSLRVLINKVSFDETNRSSDIFAHAAAYLSEDNEEMAKACIEKFISIREEGGGYIRKILNYLLLKDSESFNLMMNKFLEACFDYGGSHLSDVVDEKEYLEMLAMERGLSAEGLIKKIKSIAKRRKLDFDGIEEMPENELVLFIEENNIFKKAIPNPWFIELANICWIFTPGLALIALAGHRGIDVKVEHPFIPADLQK